MSDYNDKNSDISRLRKRNAMPVASDHTIDTQPPTTQSRQAVDAQRGAQAPQAADPGPTDPPGGTKVRP